MDNPSAPGVLMAPRRFLGGMGYLWVWVWLWIAFSRNICEALYICPVFGAGEGAEVDELDEADEQDRPEMQHSWQFRPFVPRA